MSEDGSLTVEDIQGPWDLLLVGRVGSHAYGLATYSSDEDFAGVFQVATESFLGLDSYPQTVTNTSKNQSKTVPDYTYQELGKFCRLALSGNPTILETLWLPDYIVKHPVGEQLVSLRTEFLSDRVRKSFGGYARQQLERLRRNGTSPSRGEKYVRHMFRLLREGRHLVETGELQVRVEDPEELFALGRLGFEEICERFEQEFAAFDATPSVLPKDPNTPAINEFLVQARLAALPPDKDMAEQLENAKDVIRTMFRMQGMPGKGFGLDALH